MTGVFYWQLLEEIQSINAHESIIVACTVCTAGDKLSIVMENRNLNMFKNSESNQREDQRKPRRQKTWVFAKNFES